MAVNKKCFWCKSEKSKYWFPYSFSDGSTIFFCSKKCLSSATVKGKGKCLDRYKISAKYRRDKQKIKADTMQCLMQKEKLGSEDLVKMFWCLTAKQKKCLAVVDLADMSWTVGGNPERILAKIKELTAEI